MLPARREIRCLPSLIVCLAIVLLFGARAVTADDTAAEILEATGVKGGLIVHLGCGDGKLTAALRANERHQVHGLETDATNVAQARGQIQSLGLYGDVSVDRLSGSRLP